MQMHMATTDRVEPRLMNKLECDECGLKWKKTVPLTFIYDKMFCGDCAIKILREMNSVRLEEARSRLR